MNKLFVLFPAIKEEDAGQDIAYLKLLGEIKEEDIINIFKKINQSKKLIAEENIEIYYDSKHFENLLKGINDKGMPNLKNLLVFMNDIKAIQDEGIGNKPIKVNGIQVDKGLLNAYVEDGLSNAYTLINREAKNNIDQSIVIEYWDGKKTNVDALDCDSENIYLWLVNNRNPQREFDDNYKKHTKNEKIDKNGKTISAITYPKSKIIDFLHKAVIAKNGSKILYFKDLEKNKIIVFCDENVETQKYHAYEIQADDKAELQKINIRGGRKLSERIEKTAEIEYKLHHQN